jgi:hypothetical protein
MTPMKKTLLTTALGLALMSLTFAAQPPAQTPPAGQNKAEAPKTETAKTKKHAKHHKKNAKKAGETTPAPAANSSTPSTPKK